MKLFIWPSVKALADAYWGQAYAMAPDIETAILLLIANENDQQLILPVSINFLVHARVTPPAVSAKIPSVLASIFIPLITSSSETSSP